jgi:GNAT superfamily N-acetyltransferase
MASKKFHFEPVNLKNWKDLEKLFECKGGPSYCWCMVWRNMLPHTDRSDKDSKKASLKSYVENRVPIGLVCYDKTEPIGWCSIAPRDSYRKLSGDESLSDVWSLACFFIKREYRKQSMTEKLITAAIKYAKDNNAKYVEAYPVDPDSPSYRFMGFKSTFERMGFELKHKAGERRYVMTKQLAN